MDLETLNGRLDDVRELYSATKENAESFPADGTPAYYYEGMAAQLANATSAAESAGTFYNGAVAAKNDAVAAKDTAVAAQTAAVSAKTAAESASGIAVDAKDAAVAAKTAAEQASTEAVTKVQGAAQVGESNEFTANNKFTGNNTFTGVNTFNGELVANKAATLPEQTTVDGVPLTDLQGMQAALSSFLTNIGEISLETQLQPIRGCHEKTWNDWAACNPTWPQQDTLIFYAPFAPEANRANMASNADVPSSLVQRSIWISPMLPDWDNSGGERISKALGKNICLYCTKSDDIMQSLGNCYYVKKATVITPNATRYENFMANLGFITAKTGNEMHIFAPELTTITNNGQNSTFYYMPLLDEFSIYAPKLTTSFYFSYRTNHLDTNNYTIGQTCDILQKLIDGIGAPDKIDQYTGEETTPPTITTLTPSDGDVVQTVDGEEKTNLEILNTAAASKHWQFNFVTYQKPS